MLKIITAPNKILSQPAQPVSAFDQRLKETVKQMIEILEKQTDPPGVGLAANQVGLDIALFIIKPTKKSKISVFINPKIIKTVLLKDSPSKACKKKMIKLEGCLSLPKIWGPIKRASRVLLQYQDLEGKMHQRWFSGFEAVIIQHEVDHLQGIVFTQRSLEQNQPLYEEKDGQLKRIKNLL